MSRPINANSIEKLLDDLKLRIQINNHNFVLLSNGFCSIYGYNEANHHATGTRGSRKLVLCNPLRQYEIKDRESKAHLENPRHIAEWCTQSPQGDQVLQYTERPQRFFDKAALRLKPLRSFLPKVRVFSSVKLTGPRGTPARRPVNIPL